MTDTPTRRAFAEAALAIAAKQGWSGVTLFDIAAQAKRPVVDFHPLTPNDAFECIDDYFDRAAAEGVKPPDLSLSLRDRVFDAAMRRFEAMEKKRAGVLAIEKAIDRDAVSQAAALARDGRTARWLLALAAVEGEGFGRAARWPGLALVLRQAKSAWRRDDAGDFAATMAALDKGLRRAESFVDQMEKMAAPFRPRDPKRPSADEASPEGRPEATQTS